MPLDHLPKEILNRIATRVDAQDVLTLSKTCRTLHEACYDTPVFRSIIESQQHEWETPSTLHLSTLIQQLGLGHSSVSSWARFALAGQRALELRMTVAGSASHEDHVRNARLNEWAPHLMVTKHPLMFMEFWVQGIPLEIVEKRGGFLLMAALLCLCPEHARHFQRHCLLLAKDTRLLALATLLIDIHVAISTKSFGRHGFRDAPRPIIPPTMFDIPMGSRDSAHQIPLPFSFNQPGGSSDKDDWDRWYEVRTKQMLDLDHLEDGTWCGYYNYEPRSRFFDGPMVDIKFKIDRERSITCGEIKWAVDGGGRDSIGRFRLAGVLHDRDGRLQLTKQYAGAHSWKWECYMTPFGIMGGWGQVQQMRHSTAGSVWLWKQEWTNGGPHRRYERECIYDLGLKTVRVHTNQVKVWTEEHQSRS